MRDSQSQNFLPNEYIDISNVVNEKHNECFKHIIQKKEENSNVDQGKM